MGFKSGDRVVFNWDARRNKNDDHKRYMEIKYNMPQDFIYTVKMVVGGLVVLEDLDENFFIDRFKKYSGWEVKFRKEVKRV